MMARQALQDWWPKKVTPHAEPDEGREGPGGGGAALRPMPDSTFAQDLSTFRSFGARPRGHTVSRLLPSLVFCLGADAIANPRLREHRADGATGRAQS